MLIKSFLLNPVEILEARIAPAGVVLVDYNAITGNLKLLGDDAANQVTIFQTGTNTYRIEGNGTGIDTVASSFRDVGKITSLSLIGAGGDDSFTLQKLRTLTALSFSGGDGDDTLAAQNLSVIGSVGIHGDGNFDTVSFTGASTAITGDVTVDTGLAATDGIKFSLEAQTTVIGGKVRFTGGTVASEMRTQGAGTVLIAKGVDIIAGSGGAGANFNNDGLLTIGKLLTGESVRVAGGVGNDGVSFAGVDVTLAGGIRVTGGVGDDGISAFNPTGTMRIGIMPGGRSLALDGGDDSDGISMAAANLLLAGGIEFFGGDGANALLLGPDASTIKVGKLVTGQSIRFTGGAEVNTLATASANLLLAGGIEFSEGAGDHLIQIEGASGKAVIGKLLGGQSIKLTGSVGNDVVQTGVGNLLMAGGIELLGGEGDNRVDIQNPGSIVKIGRLKDGQSIRLTGGAGTEAIAANVARLTLDGAIDLDGAGGLGSVNVDNKAVVKIGKLPTGQSLRLIGKTDAHFEANIGGLVTMAGSLEVTGGAGDDHMALGGKVIVGKNVSGLSIYFDGGDGVDALDLSGNVSLFGSLVFLGGNDPDQLDLSDLQKLTVMSGVQFFGGAGDDRLDMNVPTLLITAGLSFLGGDDSDSASVIADGMIGGNVIFDLGASPSTPQSITLRGASGSPAGLVLKGALAVDSTSAGGVADALAILNVSVAKLVDLKLGDGNSLVNIDNLYAGDEFKLDTRDGADVVNIERGSFFGNSLIRKLATIQLGLGDDELAIGNPLPMVLPPFPDSSRVNFLGGMTADGGGGVNDNRNDFSAQNDFFLPRISPIGFELRTLE